MKHVIRTLFLLAPLVASPAARADDAATLKLFKAQCATCHGIDGKGQTTAGKKVGTKDWSDPKVLKPLSDADVVKAINTGKSEGGKELMPSFSKLGPEKIQALAAYIRTFQPK